MSQPKDQKITASAENAVNKTNNSNNEAVPHDNTFMFQKENYMYMGVGLVLILVGFILMSGGKSADPNVFNYDEIYSFRRITLAPILIVLGYMVEIFAIMWTPKSSN